MANERYEVCAVRKYKAQDGSEKSSWTNIGSAWAQRDGKGFSLSLHCMPAPDPEKGEYRLVMRLPLPKDGQQQRGGGQRGGSSGGMDGGYDSGPGASDQDDIPFARIGDIG